MFFEIFQRFRIWSESKLSPDFLPPHIFMTSLRLWPYLEYVVTATPSQLRSLSCRKFILNFMKLPIRVEGKPHVRGKHPTYSLTNVTHLR